MWRLQELGLTSKLAPQSLSARTKERHQGLPTRLGRFFLPGDLQYARAVCCNMKEWEETDDNQNKPAKAPTASESTVAFSLTPNPDFFSAQTSNILQRESFELLIIFFQVVYRILQACQAVLRAECGRRITNVILPSWPSFIKGCSLMPHLYYSIAQPVV